MKRAFTGSIAIGLVLFAASSDGVQAFRLKATREELLAKVKFVRLFVAREVYTEEEKRGLELANTDGDIRLDALRTLYTRLFPPDAQKASITSTT